MAPPKPIRSGYEMMLALDDPKPIVIRDGNLALDALLGIPANAKGLVIFAHGSGSGRLSPRNNYVAAALRRAGFATLLLDLLTPPEEEHRANVFAIPLLARRLLIAADWAREQPMIANLPIGYFGASTGAAAALMAAAGDSRVAAVVSRGGRPDLTGEALARVTAPTLLIVGSRDRLVIELNNAAYRELRGRKEIVIVSGAGHLFEEPGTMDEVIRYAVRWFDNNLVTRGG